MIIKTGRFGRLSINEDEIITVSQGILGFPDFKKYCLVDPGDDTLILWLQSLDQMDFAFPLLEPKIFKPDYAVRLSAAELRELQLDNVNQAAVFSVLTIPEDVTQMTANLKAPLVLNLKLQRAKQVVLQENEYQIKHEMFKELRTHLVTIQSQKNGKANANASAGIQAHPATGPAEPSGEVSKEVFCSVVTIKDIPPSLTVKSLHS